MDEVVKRLLEVENMDGDEFGKIMGVNKYFLFMSSLEISQVSNLLLEFHPERVLWEQPKIILDFDKWSLLRIQLECWDDAIGGIGMLIHNLQQLIRDGRPSVTVEEAGKRYLILGKEIFNCDKGFGAKVDGIVDFVGRAGFCLQ